MNYKAYLPYLRLLVSTAVGGASGAVLPFLTNHLADISDGKPSAVDGHVVALMAFYGAVVAVIGHIAPSPLGCPTCNQGKKQ